MQGSSKSRISVLLVILAVVIAAFAIAGCGDEDDPAAGGSTSATASTTGTTNGATEVSGSTAAESGETTVDDGGVSPEGEDGGDVEGGAGDEEPARAPIKITVEGGEFSADTATEFHAPTYMAIELDVTVKGSNDAKLLITKPDGKKISRTFPGGKRTTYMLEGMRPGRSLLVASGSSQLIVIADLVPGP